MLADEIMKRIVRERSTHKRLGAVLSVTSNAPKDCTADLRGVNIWGFGHIRFILKVPSRRGGNLVSGCDLGGMGLGLVNGGQRC